MLSGALAFRYTPLRIVEALRPGARPWALVVCGNAGVGKSTYGRAVAAARGALLLDLDTVTERLAKVALRAAGLDSNDRDSPAYKSLLREPAYEALFDVAAENLPHACCVLVAPFTRERRLAEWPAQLQQRLGAPVEIHVLHCDERERFRRIEARNNPRDHAKLRAWASYATQGRDVERPPFAHRWIDTTHTRPL